MKALHELCETPLHVNAHALIKRDWEDITSLANVNENDGLNEVSFDNLFSSIHKDKFEKVLNEDPTNPLMQNILNVEQITFDNNELIVITLGEAFQPLGLLCDKHSQ